MKKIILSLVTLQGALLTLNAQGINTFIGKDMVVKVQPGTLFYHGGNVVLQSTDTNTEEVVLNSGNIKVDGALVNNASSGLNFKNLYENDKSFGQLIVNQNFSSTASLIIQRKSVNKNTVNYLPFSIPFRGNVTSIMKTFGLNASDFAGSCGVEVACGSTRYYQTLLTWNNNTIANDAVPSGTNYIPGRQYLLNLTLNNINTKYDGNNLIDYEGVMFNDQFETPTYKTVINDYQSNPEAFRTLVYSAWKNKINKYREYYNSYISSDPQDDNSLNAGKNYMFFGNPYSSNIDVSIPSEWLKVDGIGSGFLDDIALQKNTSNFNLIWDPNTGSNTSNPAISFYITTYVKNSEGDYEWNGQNEALLVQPTETFRVSILTNGTGAPAKLNEISANFSDQIKTFNYIADPTNTQRGRAAQSNSTLGARIAGSGSTTTNNFHQLEIALLNDQDHYITNPVFLATNDKYKTGTGIVKTGNAMMSLLAYNENGEEVPNSNTYINKFNAIKYVGLPLPLQLKNLKNGEKLSLKFRLKEGSIFTEPVTTFKSGYSFYIYDKVEDKYTKIDGNTVINMTADDNTNDRYVFYWKNTPQKKTINDDIVEDVVSKTTKLYKSTDNTYNVKFDSSKKVANIEVFNVNGAKVNTANNVLVSAGDYKINLPKGTNGLFIVKVTYEDGQTQNHKLLVN